MSTNPLEGVSSLLTAANESVTRLRVGSFRSQLRKASYRGFPFILLEASTSYGRRNAVHEYPKRDMPWVEDMGRKARTFNVVGFIVGDDVIAQRERLLELVERSDDGELVHPTLGRKQVAVLDFTIQERWDEGRKFEFAFTFIEQGKRLFPGSNSAAGKGTGQLVNVVDTSSAQAFINKVLAATQDGITTVSAAVERAGAYASRATQVVSDATSLFRTAIALPGEFGRLIRKAEGIGLGVLSAVAPGATLASLTAAGVAARLAVSEAGRTLSTLTDPSLMPGAAKQVVSAVVAASPAPGDVIRSLQALVGMPAPPVVAGNDLTVQTAAADMLRRAALTTIASTAATYEPTSTDEAVTLRTMVLGALDDEITRAGDQGEDTVYQSLRELRAATSAAINAAGAKVPQLRTVTTNTPMPSLALAQRLYRDSSRADDLVARAVPVHPAFMPVSFKALAS